MHERSRGALPEGTNPFYASLIDRSVSGMLDALGTADIEAVLMIGAPARGETTVISTPDGPYSLSDIDLVCLSRAGIDVNGFRQRLAAWVSAANQELAGSCAGLDASVKSADRLSSLPPLITTFEMMRAPVVVWGDPDVAGRLRAMAIQDVPRWDSLVLFHNRTVEQALLSCGEDDGRPSGSDRFRLAASRLYTSGKFLLDSMSALLFLEGNVPPTYTERFAAFSNDVLSVRGRARLRSALEPWLDDLDAWARFKMTGDLSSLRTLRGVREDTRDQPDLGRENVRTDRASGARYGDGELDVAVLEAMAERCLYSYAEVAAPFWRAVLGDVVGVDAMEAGLPALAGLYSKLESTARKAVRTFKILRSPAGRSGLFPTARAAALAPFASLRQLAYLTAVLCYLSVGGAFSAGEISDLMDRYSPFEVPRSFHGMSMSEKRAVLVDRLRLFHHAVLRGREINPNR